MKTITILFNSGVEKTFHDVTKFKECSDLKHYELYYLDDYGITNHVAITKDQIAMIETAND